MYKIMKEFWCFCLKIGDFEEKNAIYNTREV